MKKKLFITILSLSSCSSGIRLPVITGTVSPVYPNNGANWMDYVINNNGGTTVYNQPDAACIGNETGYYGCIHGGEKRKVVVNTYSSCSGLTASDSLGAFSWKCDDSSGTATFYSKALVAGMGLKNLINSSGTAFQNNFVSVYQNGTLILQSQPAVWWNNSVQVLPSSSSAGIDLPGPSGTIYVATSSATGVGYHIGMAKFAIVTLPGVTLTFSTTGSNYCVAATGAFSNGAGNGNSFACIDADFPWIEINGNAAGSATFDPVLAVGSNHGRVLLSNLTNGTVVNGAINLTSTKGWLIDQTLVSNFPEGIKFSTGSSNSTLNQSVISNISNIGLFIVSSNNNVVTNTIISDVATDGIEVVSGGASPTGNIFVGDTSIASNVNSLLLNNAGSAPTGTDIVQFSSLFGNAGATSGIKLSTDVATLVSGVVVFNNQTVGLLSVSSTGSALYDVAAVANTTDEVAFAGAGNNTTMGGALLVGGTNCATAGTAQINATCHYGPSLSNPTSGIALDSSFVGVATSDSSNTSNSQGLEAFNSLTDWVDFQNIYRAWGLAGSSQSVALSDSSRQGQCVGGDTCQIYDMSLSKSDPFLLNTDGLNTAFVANAPCPASVDGSTGNIVTDNNGNTFLRNAREDMNSDRGNHNGLCESNEDCIYSPNIGAYQGHGDYTRQTCVFHNGTVSGVTMFGYPNNGY